MSNMMKALLRSPADWGLAACEAVMASYSPAELPPASKWHYHQGVFLRGALRMWELTGDERTYDYTKAYVDLLVDPHGNFIYAKEELDALQAGQLLFHLDAQTGDQRYRIAADKLLGLLATFNRTSKGGYWHKDRYPYQMWLDGLYMGGAFAVHYASRYGATEWFDRVCEQERLMRAYTMRPDSGLLVHAWDESRLAPWADAATGRAPEVWGRALGWYGAALVDILEQLPENHAGRAEMTQALADCIGVLCEHQDPESGLWYQVVDKGHLADNWLETSCTSLFVYAIAKAVKLGYVQRKWLGSALRGFDGLTNRIRYDEGGLVVPDICIGTGVGDYAHYVRRPCADNDLHGIGAFVWACAELEAFKDEWQQYRAQA